MFYFADTSDRPIIDVFTPRIPISRMCYEDAITPRICLSTSLEGCFSAAPWGGEGLDINPKSVVYRIYEFDYVVVDKYDLIRVSPHTRDFSHELGDTI